MKTFELQIPVKPNVGGHIFNCDAYGNFNLEHHETFFAFVLNTAGGYSVLPKVDGAWKNEKGKVFTELMIPIRVACTDDQIEAIADFAKLHYDQEAIFVVEIGTAKLY